MKSMHYFEACPDFGPEEDPRRTVESRLPPHRRLELPPQWYLSKLVGASGQPVPSDPFTNCQPVSIENGLEVKVSYDGNPLDFTFTGLGVPVVTQTVAELIRGAAKEDVQLVPVSIERHPGPYLIVNALKCIRCIDEKHSRFTKFEAADNRPQKLGQYKGVMKLVIDPALAQGHAIFRPWGWKVALVVSEVIATVLQDYKVSGVTFRKATT